MDQSYLPVLSLFAILITTCVAVETVDILGTCPLSCMCSENTTITCRYIDFQYWPDVCRSINNITLHENVLPHLYLDGSYSNTTVTMDCLPALQSLHVSSTKFDALSSIFLHLRVQQALNLSQNEIQNLPDNMFSSLGSIQSLALSYNNISALRHKTFLGLHSLQVLDLSFNDIAIIHPSSFEVLTNLTYLNLAHNRLQHFTTWHLPPSPCLQVLILNNNALKSFFIGDNESEAMPLDYIQSFDISHNPLECSCVLQRLLHKVYAQGGVMVNIENTLCDSPSALKNRSLSHLNETALHCSNPHSLISFPSQRQSVLFTDTITLECRAEAFPSPQIMWVTPWGEKFSLAPPSLIVLKGLASIDQINLYSEYEERNVLMTSSIKVTGNNDLIISGFRGSMSGNFSCVAFNEIGSKQEFILLTVRSMIKSTYLTSLKFASYCAFCCLIIGFLIGSIHKIIRTLQHKGWTVPLFTPAPSVHLTTTTNDDVHSSVFDDLSHLSPPTSPLLGCSSDKSSVTNNYSFDWDSPEKRPHHILDSLGGAKDRLRGGVGRKMDSVRRNVQSIKESTGAYVHTIMESGSSAANKMKAGVVMGVETVKYHVQSVKELCGTGNIAHTMSIISMETDIDTNERKSIVRQVTFV